MTDWSLTKNLCPWKNWSRYSEINTNIQKLKKSKELSFQNMKSTPKMHVSKATLSIRGLFVLQDIDYNNSLNNKAQNQNKI